MKTYKQIMEGHEKTYLIRLMKNTATHTEAARVANLTRTQLFRLLDKHNITRKNGE